jgi:riboflavin kinase/FMN adenylyltransferase
LAINVYKGSTDYTGPDCVLTIGNFDGVHQGHQALIRKNQERAKALDLASVLYTFEPHPRRVLQPDNHPPRILSLEDKLGLIEDMGIEHVVVEAFSRVFAMHPATWFAQEIIQKRMRAKAMVVGHDFRFGNGRKGNAEGLKDMLPKLPLESLDAVKVEDTIASSSRIRERVAGGDVSGAAALLGRPYAIHGRVVPGSARGHGLGFPTANLDLSSELIPGRGVYAVQVHLDNQIQAGVANLGVRPTFGMHQFCLEVHLLDFERDLYDQTLKVDFIQRIREERRFDSSTALVAQIKKDVEEAKGILKL